MDSKTWIKIHDVVDHMREIEELVAAKHLSPACGLACLDLINDQIWDAMPREEREKMNGSLELRDTMSFMKDGVNLIEESSKLRMSVDHHGHHNGYFRKKGDQNGSNT